LICEPGGGGLVWLVVGAVVLLGGELDGLEGLDESGGLLGADDSGGLLGADDSGGLLGASGELLCPDPWSCPPDWSFPEFWP
jgi:hypothetical protein